MPPEPRTEHAGTIAQDGPGASVPPSVRRYLPGSDAVRMVLKPNPLFVVFAAAPWAGAGVLTVLTVLVGDAWIGLGTWGARVMIGAVVGALARVLWALLEWWNRWYLLTDRRVASVSGVLRRVVTEAPLDAIRASAADNPVWLRVFGLGTIGFATAGTAGFEVVWSVIDRPHEALDRVRSVADGPDAERRPAVIGLAGGIGAGKSTVARAFERLGCVVCDSDADARAVLARPEVVDELRRWWGPSVIGPDGTVDRSAVARIVFADEAQRRRLEGLVHPEVKAMRARVVERAGAAGAPAVVIDAPLLFEAGLDAECDAVVFVEAPREDRLARVRASRGWDEGELDRREKAQLPLERKRRASDHVIVNAGHGDLGPQAESVLKAILTSRRRVRSR